MNNRIMAMLLALVAAMFISIVPVKAEAAAAHEHVDNGGTKCVCDVAGCKEELHVANGKWESDKDGHYQWCANNCGTKLKQGEHTYGEFADQGADQHWRTCSDCGYIDKVSHSEGAKADCICDDCGRALPHKLVDVAAVEVTCEADGLHAHKKCETCGKLISRIDGRELTVEEVTIKALGHTPNGKWETDETGHYQWCINDCGTKLKQAEHNYGQFTDQGADQHWRTCSDCGYTDKVSHSEGTKVDCVCDDCGRELIHNPVNVSYKAATCEEDGNTDHRKCTVCGTLFDWSQPKKLKAEEVVLTKLGHKANGKWEQAKDNHYQWCINDCGTKLLEEEHISGDWKVYPSDKTKHFHQCTVCYKTVETEAHEYKYVDVREQYHEPVCETCGYKDKWVEHKDTDGDGDCLCDDCGHAMPHTDKSKMTYVEAKAATCTEAGNTDYYKCNECGGTFLSDGSAWDPVLKALGHDWEARPDTINGQHLQKCKRSGCGVYQTLGHEDTDGDCKCDVNECGMLVHSHTFVQVPGKAATCTEGGVEAYNKYEGCGRMFDLDQNEISEPVTTDPLGHSLSETWVPGEDGKHVKECTECGEAVESEDHNFASGVICTVCGANESLVREPAKAATCYEEGNIEYYYSPVTYKKYADADGIRELTDEQIKIAMLQHSLEWQPMADGVRHQQVCMNEGCTKAPIIELHSTANSCYCAVCDSTVGNHTLTFHKMERATCAEAGHQAYYACSCEKLYDMGYNLIEAPVVIEQLSHVMGTEVKEDAKEGKHYIQCEDCTYRMYEEHVMVVSDPLKGNYHQYLCECGELEIEQHYDKNGDNWCDVCSHSMVTLGTAADVKQHDNVTVKTGDPDTVKPTQSWWQNWLEILTPSNSGGTTSSNEEVTGSNANNNNNVNNGSNANSGSNVNNGGNANVENNVNNGGSVNNGSNVNNGGNANNGNSTEEIGVIAQFFQWLLGWLGF